MLKFKKLFDGLLRKRMGLCPSSDPHDNNPYSLVWYKWFIDDVKTYVDALVKYAVMMIDKKGSPAILGRLYMDNFIGAYIPIEGIHKEDFFDSHLASSMRDFVEEKGPIKFTTSIWNSAQVGLFDALDLISAEDYHITLDFLEFIEGYPIDSVDTVYDYEYEFLERRNASASASSSASS